MHRITVSCDSVADGETFLLGLRPAVVAEFELGTYNPNEGRLARRMRWLRAAQRELEHHIAGDDGTPPPSERGKEDGESAA